MASADVDILAEADAVLSVHSCNCSERAISGIRQGRLSVDEFGFTFQGSGYENVHSA